MTFLVANLPSCHVSICKNTNSFLLTDSLLLLLLMLLLLLLDGVLLQCFSCCSMECRAGLSLRLPESMYLDSSVCGGVLASLFRLRMRFDMRSPLPLTLCCCIKCKLDRLWIFGMAGEANRGMGKFISWLLG